MKLPFVSCLCPTYHRPECLANALACFLAQDYPVERRELVILDDAGQYASQCGTAWELVSIKRRFRSLPEKYNALAGLAKGDVLVVWEDDDVYLPWHISAHVDAMGDRFGFSKPSRVLSHNEGSLREEASTGRFHGSIACTRKALADVQGWPLTLRGDFDQLLLGQLSRLDQVGDPLERQPCSYIFRWDSTSAYHGQRLMPTPDDESWYERAAQDPVADSDQLLVPKFDAVTRQLWQELRLGEPAWGTSISMVDVR